MKPKKLDGVEVWRDFEDLAARLGLNVIERAVYSYLLLHTRLEGKPRLHFTLPELARKVRISRGPVRAALHRLASHGALRFIERSYSGHLVEVRLPAEVPAAPHKTETSGPSKPPAALNLEELDFLAPASCARPSTRARAANAFIAGAGFPAGPAAWTTWCHAPGRGSIRTAIWFPAAPHATGKKGITPRRISCGSTTARGGCRATNSADALGPCARLWKASYGPNFQGVRMEEWSEEKEVRKAKKSRLLRAGGGQFPTIGQVRY
jgi:hypothetical protein